MATLHHFAFVGDQSLAIALNEKAAFVLHANFVGENELNLIVKALGVLLADYEPLEVVEPFAFTIVLHHKPVPKRKGEVDPWLTNHLMLFQVPNI